MRCKLRKVANIEHAHAALERLIQHLPVGMAWVLQRFGGLQSDRVGGHKPQHKREIFFNPDVFGNSDRMRGKDCLAAPGGQAQTNIGHIGLRLHWLVARRIATQTSREIRIRCDRFISGLWAGNTGLFKELTQGCERGLLIILQLHLRAFTS